MNPTIRLGTVAGIPVGVHWSVLVLLVLLGDGLALIVLPAAVPGQSPPVYWLAAAMVVVLFLASLLAHEFAHALVARAHGVRVERITVWMLGGVAQLSGEARTPKADLLIAAVGPLTSLVLAGVYAAVAIVGTAMGAPALVVSGLWWLAVINTLLAVFNLLPGAPLDGGRVLRAILWWRYGDHARAVQTASRTGMALGGAMTGLGLLQMLAGSGVNGLWFVFLGWFIWWAAMAEGRADELREELAGLTVAEIMTPDPVCAPGSMPIGDFLDQVVRAGRLVAFPVLDAEGRPQGLVTVTEVAGLTPEARAVRRVADVSIPMAELVVVAPDEPLANLASRPLPDPAERLVLVVDEGRLVGVVSTGDIVRAIRRAPLRMPAPGRLR